jgi:hypothetical protein
VLLQRRDAAAAWLCCNAAGLLETLHPDHPTTLGLIPQRSAASRREAPVSTFNHSGTQSSSASLAPKNESMPADSLIDKALGILPIRAERNLL